MTSSRLMLRTRRPAECIKFNRGNLKFYGTLGFADQYAEWPSEVFLQGGKVGSELEATCRDFAVAVSLGLQYGVPFLGLRDAMTRLDDGTAAGPGGQFLDLIVKG